MLVFALIYAATMDTSNAHFTLQTGDNTYHTYRAQKMDSSVSIWVDTTNTTNNINVESGLPCQLRVRTTCSYPANPAAWMVYTGTFQIAENGSMTIQFDQGPVYWFNFEHDNEDPPNSWGFNTTLPADLIDPQPNGPLMVAPDSPID